MTRLTWGAASALILAAPLAHAGALDRSGQPVTALFEPGNYADLSFGYAMPNLEGTATTPLGASGSGDVGADYAVFGLSLKYDVTPNVSLAFIVDNPFGADPDYGDADAGYPLAGTTAAFNSVGYTALARYRFDNGFSVHAGARAVTVDANLDLVALTALGPQPLYAGDFASDTGFGYVVGAAYERPEIALRVALTYSSAIAMAHDTSATLLSPAGPLAQDSTTEYDLPQSVNLDFRTGIAEGTALFGQVRWVDWSELSISEPLYTLGFGGPIVGYPEDYWTYTLGVGRQLTDRLTGTAAVFYEPAAVNGEGVDDLSPYDGQAGVILAATYRATDAVEVTGSVRYTRLGRASTPIGAEFEDGDLLALGARLAYRF